MSTKKEKLKSIGLRALNDLVIIKEDPIKPTVDRQSGLTRDVVEAIGSGRLFIPDQAEYALCKFPFTGTIIKAGPKVKTVAVGDHVMFARLGGQRWEEDGQQFLTIRETEIHAIIT